MARVRVDGIGIPDADSYYERIRGESSLVAYFPLTENHCGRVLDTHGGRLGDVVGSPTVADEDVPYGEKAMTLDGTNDYVSIPYEAAFNGSDFSVEGWFYRDADTGGGEVLAYSFTANTGYYVHISGSDTIRFVIGNGAGTNIATGPTVSTGEWNHFAATYTGTSAKLYLNGAQVASVTATISANATQDFLLGSDGGTSKLQGKLAHVNIHNAALTPAQINRHYSAFANAVLNLGPVGYWRLNEASGTTATDLGSGGNDGTYTNTPTLGAAGLLQDDPGSATDFDKASSEYVTIPYDAALNTSEFTAIMLTKPEALTGTQVLLDNRLDATKGYIIYWSGTTLYGQFQSAGPSSQAVTANIGVNGTTKMVGLLYDGANGQIINEGTLGTAQTRDFVVNPSAGPVIAAEGAGTIPFDGVIQEVILFNRALSAQEIDDLYKLAKNALTPRVLVRS